MPSTRWEVISDDNFRVTDHPGVIAWWLESKCRVRPLLRLARYAVEITSEVAQPFEVSRDHDFHGVGGLCTGLHRSILVAFNLIPPRGESVAEVLYDLNGTSLRDGDTIGWVHPDATTQKKRY